MDWSSDVCSSDLEGTIQFAEWMPNSDELIIDGMVVNKDGRRHGAGSPVRNLNGDAYYGNGKALYIFRSAHADQNSGVRVVGDSKFKFEIRSEEHTSELQSLMRISYAVFCLKNKIQKPKLKSGYNTSNQ